MKLAYKILSGEYKISIGKYLKKFFSYMRTGSTLIIIKVFSRMISSNMFEGFPEGPTIIFAPHEDDELLGCSGIIARRIKQGGQVIIIYLTDGRYSRRSPMIAPDTLAEIRKREAINAAVALGMNVSNLFFLEFQDRHLTQFQDAAKDKISQILKIYNPTEIFLPYRKDDNLDHTTTFNIVISCLLDLNLNAVVFEYPIWINKLWFWQIKELFSSRAIAVNVEAEMNIKEKALLEYQAQVNYLPKDILYRFHQKYEIFFYSTIKKLR